ERYVAAALWGIAGIGFAIALLNASSWQFAARLMPQTASIVGLAVVLTYALTTLSARYRVREAAAKPGKAQFAESASHTRLIYTRLGSQLGWLVALLSAVLVIGIATTAIVAVAMVDEATEIVAAFLANGATKRLETWSMRGAI
ncbi:hypothetical protein B4Q13_22495, partial [Lacticaseibacillus rhamnosus]